MGTKERYGSEIPFTFSLEGEEPMELKMRPSNLTVTRRKRLNRYQTRSGWVEEDWGDELARISGDGFTDGFYHPGCGYTRVMAKDTDAYRSFLNLLDMYRNNGYQYGPNDEVVEGIYDTYSQPVAHVVMNYRESLYQGYFDSFSWTEEADQPFRFSWSFEFTVVRTLFGY